MAEKLPEYEYNFTGSDRIPFEKSRIAIVPAPYDGTASYKKGAVKGPDAILDASRNIEWYDEELDYEPYRSGFFTFDKLPIEKESPEKAVNEVEKTVEKILKAKKFPLILGGEHSISAGAFTAFKKARGDFSILQFDAHPDLRNEYEGSKYNHACVMRRAFDLKIDIVQIGIRSVCIEDHEFMERNKKSIKTFYSKDMGSWNVRDIAESLKDDVYISFDIDAFDSSIMPATGTPEPGGMYWRQVMEILRAVSSKRQIIGADVVELSPIPGFHACDFLAAKLAYKIIGYAFKKI